MKRWVTDTGPLLHLHQAGFLELLPGMGEMLTPPAVASEWRRLAPDFAQAGWPVWLSEVALPKEALAVADNWMRAGLLDRGEAEALALARVTESTGIVTDDAAAREMAAALGFEVSGSLGVVLLAAARGVLDRGEAFGALERLESHSTLWLSARVRTEARAALERIIQAGRDRAS